MDFQKGERVFLNFDTGGVEKTDQNPTLQPTFPTFVGDIQERQSSAPNPPLAPTPKVNVNGFPAHRKRTPRVSAFKQQRAAKEQEAAAASKPQNAGAPRAKNSLDEERRAIDEENRRTLAAMSDREIEQEREELLSTLSPALIQKLLMRTHLNEGSNEQDLYPEEHAIPPSKTEDKSVEPEPESKPSTGKKVSFAAEDTKDDAPAAQQEATPPTPTPTPSHIPPSPQTQNPKPLPENSSSIHFPAPPQPPDLDPSSPTFLSSLHEKYFPDLPYDPSTLSWLKPLDPSDTTSPYHPSHHALAASELRFDFTGALLPPSVARSLPTDLGLHHHAAAPEAAGYTIPELAVTARSQVAAQRCVAYQTLGRILYRLGKGEFGVEKARQDTDMDGPVNVVGDPEAEGEEEEEEEDVGSAMAAGLWSCIEEGRVIETLTEEANRTRGHLTARTFAQEALWNWRRGGGRLRQAV